MSHNTRSTRQVHQGEEEEEGEITLQQQVILLRQELQALRASTQSPSGSGAGRRRLASSDLGEGAARALAPRLRPIPAFTGKSLREHREHVQGAITHFNALREHDERIRVDIAANALQGDALDDWFRLRDKPVTWVAYEATTRSFVQSQESRMGAALLAVKKTRQGGRTVRELAHWLEEQWDDIPELSLEERKAWDLVNALDPQLRTAVLRDERSIHTRAQIVSAALRIQELEMTGTSSERRRPTQDPAAVEAARPEAGVEGKRICFRCKQEGHIRRDCPLGKK